MRVRVNFTLEVDPEAYREASGEELSKEEIRHVVQETAIRDVMSRFNAEGVPTRLLGRNNVYDASTRSTRSEQLVGNS